MLKQIIVLILVSIAVVFLMSYAQQAVQLLINAHDWIAQSLRDVFSGGSAGNLVRGLIALLSVPILFALLPSLIYWAVKRNWFPYFMQVVWVVWLIQAGALVVMYTAAGA